ncbi:pantothenate synthetase [Alicyclobacillus hesperidum]|uniref:Pantothenate synthetase n=1 Tax=Alicyclobacillus hesperidum TaxID=89784 RepID=A0A1H2WWE2_9BACL|nr:pantoate--beta-alanine ligase [Alicyclobacillus hesperidum]GLV13040.1 pantothenate synthetase [Alicyclobacillus hesperidum]SDW84885.1 pantoate--beta-alanine ligase [Alicyclobacillus hesperidum]
MAKSFRQCETILDLRQLVAAARANGQRIALVPTMGYLHEGHLALVEAASREADFVVVSIFVNPLQFGANEDLSSYPRDLARDLRLLAETGQCDVAFTPEVAEMYPRPMATTVQLPDMAAKLCGKTRPGHFAGVATVVSKLFHIVAPDVACFGQKDGQQLAIIRRMVADLNMPIEIVSVPTVREADGLAKSSRNVYLSPEERDHATILYRTLSWAREQIANGNRDGKAIASGMRERIAADPIARLDYAEVVSLADLESIDVIEGDVMLAVAAYFGKARLIDNLQLNV